MWNARTFSVPILAPACFLLGTLLCGSLGCSSGNGIANRLQERLKDIAESGRPSVSPDEIEAALAHQLRVAPVPAKGSNRPSSPAFPTRQTLREFYAQRGQRLAWCSDKGRVLEGAETLLDALSRAGDHGLDPEDYALGQLQRMRSAMQESRGKDASVTQWADFDLLLTTAFFRYASDLSTGRLHPDEIRSEWHTDPPELDLPKALESALQQGTLAKLLEELPPPHAGYARLQLGLQQLRELQQAGGWTAIPDGQTLQKGSRGPRVALLRQRLEGRHTAIGHRVEDTLFDAALEEKVKQFQSTHGIEPDGAVAEPTLAELNVPVERRIRQVELNLERWRWMPRLLGDTHLEVNIPGFELQLIQGDRPSLESRIVVGQSFTPTPVFSDRIVAVIANPPWNVPDTLAVREYLPELRENPASFQRHGIRIFESSEENAREVDPAGVHWARVDDDEFHYHLRQDPGPDNALGRMKFHLTNDFQIYLHDTPARSLFAKQDRDLSHGCIRVEKARELADRVLGEASGKLEEALESEDEKAISVRPPIPVHILYLTAWADADGALRFAPDIYDFDAPQLAALDRAARQAGLPAARPAEAKTPEKPPKS